jgi:hypothetical protein
MSNWFQLGGFAMWSTAVFGVLMVGSSARYAFEPGRRMVPLVVSLGIITVLSGSLGFVTGLIKSLNGLPHVDPGDRWIWMVGLGESLVNVAFALALVSIATLAMVVGSWRLSRAS